MLEIIIALLLAFGLNLDKEGATVIDERTGEVFGVGNNVTIGNSEINPPTYILCQDDNGGYYLVQK